MYDMITSNRPRDLVEMLKDKFKYRQERLEQGVVVWHEKWVTGDNYSKTRQRNRRWYNNFFNMKNEY